MKPLSLTLFFFLFVCSLESQETRSVHPALEGFFKPYQAVRDFTLSPGGDEAYFTLQSPRREVSVILKTEKIQGVWTPAKIASFSGRWNDLEPFLSPDGNTLYFASNRPSDPLSDSTKDYDIWYVTRSGVRQPWSIPQRIDDKINTAADEFYPTVASNGNLYFTSDRPDVPGKDEIYCSIWDGTNYGAPFRLSEAVNTDGYEFNAYIAPDNSYLIFSGYKRKDGFGSGDLYLSIKEPDGSWSAAENLGKDINSDQMDYCPFVHLPSESLYFSSRRSRVRYPDRGFDELKVLLDEVDKYENGRSRIYRTHFVEPIESGR